MGIRVRVSTGAEGGILRMVGWSVGGHIAFTVVLVFLPRFIPREPPPPILLTADIVSADQLRAPGGPPAPRPAPAGPSPQERAERAREAVEKKKEPPKPPPEPRKAEPKPEKEKEAAQPVKVDRTTPPPPGEKPEKPSAAPEPEPPPAEPTPPLQEGVGLSAPGGGGDSDIPSITSASFPYQYYRTILVNNIRGRWNRPLTPGLRESLRCAVSFVISKRGQVSNVALSVPSGFPPLDDSAVRAVLDSSPLPPLPFQYTTSSVRAQIIFELTPD